MHSRQLFFHKPVFDKITPKSLNDTTILPDNLDLIEDNISF